MHDASALHSIIATPLPKLTFNDFTIVKGQPYRSRYSAMDAATATFNDRLKPCMGR